MMKRIHRSLSAMSIVTMLSGLFPPVALAQVPPPPTSMNDASCVSVSVPSTIKAGTTFTASVTVKNTGIAFWYPNQHYLSSLNTNWKATRSDLYYLVSKNMNYTFYIAAKAPVVGGVYDFKWQMSDLRGTKFGQICSASITVERQLGDVNNDGKIGSMDLVWLSQYLSKLRTLTPDDLKAADVNQDGRVSKADERILGFRVVGCISTLPWAFGDANLDGKIDALDLAIVRSYIGRTDVNTVSDGCNSSGTRSIRMSDVNEDGKVTAGDYYLMQAKIGAILGSLPQLYGDVTGDGTVSSMDTSKISRYVAGLEIPTVQQRFLADLNADGKLDAQDVMLSQKLATGLLTQADMPMLCGNGILNNQDPATEQCDDRNTVSGDGCSATCQREPTADLSLQKKGPASVLTGTGLSYIITVTNNGPDAAQNVTIVDTFPAGLQYLGSSLGSACTASGVAIICRPGALAASGKTLVTLNFNVPKTMACGSGITLRNVASVTSTTFDPILSNNSNASSPVVTAVLCPPRLLGDVDNSGVLSSADAFLVIQHVLGIKKLTGDDLRVADVDLNGKVERLDSHLIVGAALGLIKLPAVFGDLDGNARISSGDVTLLMRFVAGTATPTAAQSYLGDMDGDKKLTSRDVTILQRLIVGTYTTADMPLLCGNATVDTTWGETCDDRNIDSGDGCSMYCKVETVQNELTVSSVKPLFATGSAVTNQKNITLLRFQPSPDVQDILFTGATFDAVQGSLLNAQNYTLWADTNGDKMVDTKLQSGVAAQQGKVIFGALVGGGFVLPKSGTIATLEVHADVASTLTGTQATLQLKFATSLSDYVKAQKLADGSSITGIKTDGVCVGACQITVTTVPSTLWNFVPSAVSFRTQPRTFVRNNCWVESSKPYVNSATYAG